MNTKQLLVISTLIFCVLFIIFIYQPRQDTTESTQVLRVGIMSGYEPYARLNPDGTYTGFDIDVAHEIARRLNKKIEFKDMGIAQLLIALDQKSIDLLLSALSITQERKQKINMVYYQGDPVKAFILLFWQAIPAGVTTLTDLIKLPNTIICTEAGTQKEKYLQELGIPVRSMPMMSDIIMDIKYGKSTAAFLEPEVVPSLKKHNPELVTLEVPMPESYQSEGFGIGINKSNSILTADVERVIAEMRQDGTLATFERRWFGDDTV